MKKIFIILIIAVVAITAIIISVVFYTSSYNIAVNLDMNVCSLSGETETISLDFTIENNLVDPLRYNGRITWRGRTYIDYYTRVFAPEHKSLFLRLGERFKVSSFDLSPEYIGGIYRRFYDESAAERAEIGGQIELYLLEYKDGRYIYVRETEASVGIKTGIEYYGPAENSDEAQAIADIFTEFYISGATE